MSDLQTITGHHNTATYGVDDYGEFGSLAAPESDFQVPEPDRSARSPIEDQLASLASQ